LAASGHVEDLVGHLRGGCEDVGPGHVVHVDEVDRRRPVAEDQRGDAGGDAFHPLDHDLGVPADGHPGPVDVEVPKCYVVEAVHLLEAAEELLVEALAGTVQGAVGGEVVAFWGRKLLGHPVDGGRRGSDETADTGGDGGFEDVEGGVYHDLDSETGLLRALGDADGRLVEDDVDAGHGTGAHRAVGQVRV